MERFGRHMDVPRKQSASETLAVRGKGHSVT